VLKSWGNAMALQRTYGKDLFAALERGDADASFDPAADDVHWTVQRTPPHAGTYTTQAELGEAHAQGGAPFYNTYC